MFVRPIKTKRSRASNFSGSVGENSSVAGSSDGEGIGPSSDRNNGASSQHDPNSNKLSSIRESSHLKTVRKANSNSMLRPPLARYSGDGMSTLSPQIHIDFGTRRSISGVSAPPKQVREVQQDQYDHEPPLRQTIQHPAIRAMISPYSSGAFSNTHSTTDILLEILSRSHNSPASLQTSLNDLRLHILRHGVPIEDSEMEYPVSNSIRCRVWKSLLGIHHLSANDYIQLVSKGPSPMFEKVRNDTFRTLATDRKFMERVQEAMLTRVLNATVWKAQAEAQPGAHGARAKYVQGMNVLVAPFLFVMPEVDAFFAYNTLLKVHCPMYVQPTMAGVHCGLKLMDRCFEVLDAELYFFLKTKALCAEIYAFASILTLSACTPPLDELLKLWDFLLAFGIHLNVICTISQLMLIRQSLLTSPSPIKHLRTFPELKAQPIIQLTRHLVKQLPSVLYEDLVNHPYDSAVCDRYLNDNRFVETSANSPYSSPVPLQRVNAHVSTGSRSRNPGSTRSASSKGLHANQLR